MKKLLKQTNRVVALILGIFLLGCSSDDGGGVELPKVVAGFTFTLNADTGTATFKNTSNNANSYAWDFGDGNSSTETNPIKNFSTGTYTVSLKASNDAGSSDTFEDEITVELPEEGAMVSLPVTFDSSEVNYEVTAFEGVAFNVVDNPAPGGSNTVASKVGAITNIGAVFEGFYFDLGNDIDLTENKTIKMNFWADSAVDVLMKLEEGTSGALEVTRSHGGTGWEELLFDFSSDASYSRLTLFVDGPGTTTGTFYIDDIEQIETVGGGDVTCVAETMQSLNAADFNLTFMSDPTSSIESYDANFSWVNNPDVDDVLNNSCKVGQINRVGSAEFANNQIVLDAKLDFSANAGFKMKVWSPNAGTSVLVKLEDQVEAGIFTESFATTTQAGAWEELTFPIAAGENGKHDRIILFFELNTNTTETYYIDDFALYAREGGTGGNGTDEDNLITNGGFETGDTTGWETDIAGNNGSFTATDTAFKCDTYSGSFSADSAQLMVVRQANIGVGVVTPNSDITISFDLRGAAGVGGVFIAQLFSESTTDGVTKTDILNDGNPISLTDAWTRYSFTTTTGPDVSNGVTLLLKSECGAVDGCSVQANIDNVFVGLGTESGPACDGGSTGGGTGGGTNDADSDGVADENDDCPNQAGPASNNGCPVTGGTDGIELAINGDFETGDDTGWTIFENNGVFNVTNVDNNGGSFSGTLVSDVDGGTGGASFPVLKQANVGIGVVMPNSTVVVSFDMRGSLSGAGGVFFAEFFSELATEGVSKTEILSGGPLFPTENWTTYTYTVTTGPDVSGGVTLQLKTDCGPVAGCGVEAFLDNVSIRYIE
ncbi:carbohydrate binding domain-containing protein [Maribacter sp. CXY002]|uniref:carbohydrate binding domain-containing protein n=1 Tax=Maribacter luteocoastalis TaxID=3407671 RepID=UPI003B67FB9E